MLDSELLEWVTKQNKLLSKKFPDGTQKEKVLAQLAKLHEESGELAGEILGAQKQQREEKLEKSTKESLGSEFADVIICTLLLADTTGVDMRSALQKKIEVIDERFKNYE